MVLSIVFSEHVLVTVDFVLRQVGLLLSCLHLLPELAADIAEVMRTAIMNIQLVLIVEVLSRTEEAMRVLLIDVLLKWLVLVIRLLEDEDWFVLQTQLTEVDFVCIHDVVAKGFLC
jgi:hypothetical protein